MKFIINTVDFLYFVVLCYLPDKDSEGDYYDGYHDTAQR